MPIDPQTAGASIIYDGKTYFFCSENCKQQFERAPEHYATHPGLTQVQQVKTPGATVIARDDDIQTQGVDVTTTHPHAMTSGADIIATPGDQTISRSVDVVEPVVSNESSASADDAP